MRSNISKLLAFTRAAEAMANAPRVEQTRADRFSSCCRPSRQKARHEWASSYRRHWLSWGIRPVVLILHAEPAELAPDFAALGIDCITLDIPRTGRTRYFILVARVFALARKHRALGLLSMPFGWHAFIALGARLGGVRRVVAHVGNYPNIANRFAFAKFKILVQLGLPPIGSFAAAVMSNGARRNISAFEKVKRPWSTTASLSRHLLPAQRPGQATRPSRSRSAWWRGWKSIRIKQR